MALFSSFVKKCPFLCVTGRGGEVQTVKCKYEYLNISPPAGKLIIYCKKWSVYSSCIVCHDTTNTNLCGRAGCCSLLSAGKIINSHHTDINFLNIHRGIDIWEINQIKWEEIVRFRDFFTCISRLSTEACTYYYVCYCFLFKLIFGKYF